MVSSLSSSSSISNTRAVDSQRSSNTNSNSNKDTIQYMLSHLSDDELEIAAKTSYDYIRMNNHNNKDNNHLLRIQYASDMANRYYQRYPNNINKAIQCMKDTIQFRYDEQIDLLIHSPTNYTSNDNKPLRSFLSTKSIYISGYDINGRSTYYFVPRNIISTVVTTNDINDIYMKKGHLYSIERAIACSKAKDKSINAIIDLNGFISSKHSPSYQLGTDLMNTLNKHYTNHINHIYFINAPITFIYIWNIFKHLVIHNSKQKKSIHFIKTKSTTKTIPNTNQQQQYKNHNDQYNSNSNNNNQRNIINHVIMTESTTTHNNFNNRIRNTMTSFFLKQQHNKQQLPQRISSARRGGGSGSSKYDDTNNDNATTSTKIKTTTVIESNTNNNKDNDSSSSNTNIIHQLYTNDQIPSWMIPGGKKNRELDINEYLDRIPFHHAFDE